jgi:N-carbamoyl-L-amino-acid hydrolase
VTVEGDANHTGTTAMRDRTDALAAASEFVLDLEAAAQDAADAGGDTAVATVGDISVSPGAVNVVPGQADLSVDIRDVDATVIEQLVERTRTTLDTLERDRGVTTTVDRPYDIPPTDMSPVCREALHEAATKLGLRTVDLHSGAGHDTMQVATVTDAGLIFAPSQGGHSHNASEWTPWPACATTTELLAAALGNLTGASPESKT